jgi:hypothetical protein
MFGEERERGVEIGEGRNVVIRVVGGERESDRMERCIHPSFIII